MAFGFDPGIVDGIPGPQTSNAIKRYEASKSLPILGNIDRLTIERLTGPTPIR